MNSLEILPVVMNLPCHHNLVVMVVLIHQVIIQWMMDIIILLREKMDIVGLILHHRQLHASLHLKDLVFMTTDAVTPRTIMVDIMGRNMVIIMVDIIIVVRKYRLYLNVSK